MEKLEERFPIKKRQVHSSFSRLTAEGKIRGAGPDDKTVDQTYGNVYRLRDPIWYGAVLDVLSMNVIKDRKIIFPIAVLPKTTQFFQSLNIAMRHEAKVLKIINLVFSLPTKSGVAAVMEVLRSPQGKPEVVTIIIMDGKWSKDDGLKVRKASSSMINLIETKMGSVAAHAYVICELTATLHSIVGRHLVGLPWYWHLAKGYPSFDEPW
ncbi:hypothetical protein VNO77_34412 [Canavalia gladiata]|uniref:Uncharacterized protein n=1 Tax=Canavalia gladiata TaxID=3824 RepID=A0AAN9KGA2_CANGL